MPFSNKAIVQFRARTVIYGLRKQTGTAVIHGSVDVDNCYVTRSECQNNVTSHSNFN